MLSFLPLNTSSYVWKCAEVDQKMSVNHLDVIVSTVCNMIVNTYISALPYCIKTSGQLAKGRVDVVLNCALQQI